MPKNPVFLLLLFFLFAKQAAAEAGVQDSTIFKVVSSAVQHSGTEKVGVSIVPLSANPKSEAVAFHGSRLLKPASVLKLILSTAILKRLGPDYRFKTEIWSSGSHKKSIKTLVLRGSGDPSLTIESLWLIARRVRKTGVRQIKDLLIDTSTFSDERSRLGQRAYQAGSSAVALNFNCFNVTICPGAPGRSAVVTADPWEGGIALSGSVRTIATDRSDVEVNEQKDGSFKVEGAIYADSECWRIYRSVAAPERYVGEVFRKLLEAVGIKVSGRVRYGPLGLGLQKLFVHHSKPLSQILWDLNHYSTNFIAEQLVFALGEADNGLKSRQRGLSVLRRYVRSFTEDAGVVINDGSGLSHNNRISAGLLTDILKTAHKDPFVAPEFEASLSVAGESGTLQDRDFPKVRLVRAKTGTLNGVRSLAGYVVVRGNRKYAFAILQNGVKSAHKAEKLEQAVLNAVQRYG